jgi:HAD superfamily hydrolase (TIGR01549 family)
MQLILFDLDQTLLDTAMLRPMASVHDWAGVRASIDKATEYIDSNGMRSHELPTLLSNRNDVTCGIVTNSPRWYAEYLIEKFRIKISVVVTSTDCVHPKPSPEPIVRAMNIAKFVRENTVFVGDSTDDLNASIDADVRFVGAVWLNRELAGLAETLSVFESPTDFLEHVNANR